MKAIPILLLGILLSFCDRAWALDGAPNLRQLNHRVFTATDGAPSDIRALAQTPDGTLWIGSLGGLTRFDGVRFTPYPSPGEEPLQSFNVSSLFVAPDGGLWIGFRPGGIALLKAGQITHFDERDGLPAGTVAQFAWDRDGSLWAATRLGLAHLQGKRWKVVDDRKLGTPYGVLVDRAGTLWVATLNGLFARALGESDFRAVDHRVYSSSQWLPVASAPDGRLWAAPDNSELVRVDRLVDPQRDGVVAVRGISGGPLLIDTEGSLWVADMAAASLQRVPSRDLTLVAGKSEMIVRPEKSSLRNELNSVRVFSLLEDRERNIWVGTDTGLHRLSHNNVVREAAPLCRQRGIIEAAFVAGDSGALWMACEENYVTHVSEIRDGVAVSRQVTPSFTNAYRDREGTVWFGGPTALGHLDNGRVVTTPMPPAIRGRPIQALVRDGNGAMWVSVSRRGLFRFLDGEWFAYGNLDSLPRTYPIVATLEEGGALWFGYPNNRIARVNGSLVKLFDRTQGVEVGNVLAIQAQGGEVWVGGELGFARFNGTRFVSIRSTSGTLFRGVSGIIQARNGDLWLNGTRGIVHIARQEIERVLRDPAHPVKCETFDHLDGVQGVATQLRPQPSAIETTDGRIWFSTTVGIVSIDPTRLIRNTLPPPVTIWALTSGSVRYANHGPDLRLPVHTTDLQIEYSAGSLTVPERVHFRYKLVGSDHEWQDVGTRREAVYTNLGPGRYTFRVTAANNDGVWNNTGASIDFTIAPAFYQTRWFYALCVLLFVACLAGLYRIRVRQVAAQVRGRLEARLAERERIARDLHDTLLQGMQGLILRFQAATNRIPPGQPARQLMEQTLDRADELLAEGRDKVKDLRRVTNDVPDLTQALAAAGEHFAQLHPAKFRVSVQGTCRELHPIAREEAFLIGREALGNAFQHADAGNIEAEVTYGDAALHVRIRDDGEGISAAILDAGERPGHFGLIGMRERAKKLGAHLEIWSKPGAGTEVDLRVPAEVIYRPSQTGSGGSPSQLATARSSALES